jgi:hypothetical protein
MLISLAGRLAVQIRLRAEIQVEKLAMAQPSGHPVNLLPANSPQGVFQLISERLYRASGIDLSKYCTPQSLTKYWIGVLAPTGLKFTGPRNIGDFEKELAKSNRFAKATGGWDTVRIPKHGSMFREVSEVGSLHIILKKPPDECEIHLDKISIVKGRNRDGSIEYVRDISTLGRHAAMELCHMEQSSHVYTPMDGGADRDGF